MPDTSVKYMHSAMAGAPTLNGTAGTLIAVLDACLVNGFGSGTVDSIVISGGIATVTRSAGHPFEVGSIALISGATVTGGSINGEQRVLTAPSANVYTFDATGIPNQTATGTISHKVAPLGWAKTFSGTNLAAYKPSDVAATGCLLRVDDTGTQNARVVGYETMSDINTGTGPFPTTAQISGGAYWPKSTSADSTTRGWVLVGDGRYFMLSASSIAGAAVFHSAFGDFLSNKSPDAYGCLLSASNASIPGNSTSTLSMSHASGNSVQGGLFVARGSSGLGSAQSMARAANTFATSGYSGGSGSWPAYPNPADNGLLLSQISLIEASPQFCLRGTIPGTYFAPQVIGTGVFANRESVVGVTGLSGRTLKALVDFSGVLLVDITGPWR